MVDLFGLVKNLVQISNRHYQAFLHDALVHWTALFKVEIIAWNQFLPILFQRLTYIHLQGFEENALIVFMSEPINTDKILL